MKTWTTRFAALVVAFSGIITAANADETAQARLNALDYGVKLNDEKFDNTAALQSALDAAGDMGGAVVELPSGRFRFDGTLVVPTGVTLQGTYRVPPTVVNKDERPTGTTLLTYANRGNPDGAPFINLKGSNSAIKGLVVTYPEWSMTVVPPTPYPPCVASEDTENVGVIDCCLLNPYEGIRFHLAHRHLVRNVTGYPSWRGLFVDECYDIGHIENVHFWPFGVLYKPDDPYCEWVNVNGTAFEFARTDWHYVSNTFCFGYGRGYYFSDHGKGGTNGNFLGIGADSCRRAVLVEQSQKQGLLITNGEFVGRWTSEDSVCVEIGEENDGAVMLNNCSFWGPVKTCVLSKQKTGRVTLTACEFVNWDEVHSRNAKTGSAAVEIEAGRATLQGCSFEQGGAHLAIGKKALYVTAVGNQAPGGFHVVGDVSPFKTQFAANELDSLDAFPDGKTHYQVLLGSAGDSRFIRYWYGPEENATRTFRWSGDESRLVLPLPEKVERATVTLILDAPDQAAAQDGDSETPGVYFNDQLLAPIKPGPNALQFEVEPKPDDFSSNHEITLYVRCRGWRPVDFHANSKDERTLGVACFKAIVRTPDAREDAIFNANTGEWTSEEEE